MKKLLSSRILSIFLIVAMIFPTSVANAALPSTTNLYITGFVGAEVTVTDLDGNNMMTVLAPGFYSKYIEPGTEVFINWKVDDEIPYHVEIDGQPHPTTEKQMRITMPAQNQVFDFKLVKDDNPFLPSDTNAYLPQEWIADLMEAVDFEEGMIEKELTVSGNDGNEQ